MIDIAILLGSYQLARVVAELTGIVESIGVKIDRLSASELQAAFRTLDQAQRTTKERTSLLRDARDHFNKALSLERGERLAAAYIALGVTHHQLGDHKNTEHVLREFLEVDFAPQLTKAVGKAAGVESAAVAAGVAVAAVLFPVPVLREAGALWAMSQLQRQKRLEELKHAVRSYLESGAHPEPEVRRGRRQKRNAG